MKRIVLIFIFNSLFIIIIFLLFQKKEDLVLHTIINTKSSITYCFLSGMLLILDIILPIPSSLIMILNGKILGIWFGSLLSLTTGLASAIIGFYIGRRLKSIINPFFSADEIYRSDQMFKRFGLISICLSRALPIIAESLSVLSGTTSMTSRAYFIYSFVGQFLTSIIYGVAGSMTNTINSNLLLGSIIVCILVLVWIVTIKQKIAVKKNQRTNSKNLSL